MTFWKRQCGDGKKVSGCQELEVVGAEGGWDEWVECRGFGGIEIIFYDTIIVATCHCTLVRAHRMYNTKSEP